MARYGQAFKDKIIARLLPPESASLSLASREVGVSESTLERWLSTALAEPGRDRIWTPAARFDALLTAVIVNIVVRYFMLRTSIHQVLGGLRYLGSATPRRPASSCV